MLCRYEGLGKGMSDVFICGDEGDTKAIIFFLRWKVYNGLTRRLHILIYLS